MRLIQNQQKNHFSMQKRIQDLPLQERPREKLYSQGSLSLRDEELLAIFIGSGLPEKNATIISQELIEKYGSLTEISRLDISQLCQEKGIGKAKATKIYAAFELGKRIIQDKKTEKVQFNKPQKIYNFIAPEMVTLPYESLKIILVNTKLEKIKIEEISRGTINETIAEPRDILSPAVSHKAYGLILIHNHPSGNPSPSQADNKLTENIKKASDLMGIQFIDHIIIGNEGKFYSFKESSSYLG